MFVGNVAEDSLGLPHGEAIVVHDRDAVHRILHFTLELEAHTLRNVDLVLRR